MFLPKQFDLFVLGLGYPSRQARALGRLDFVIDLNLWHDALTRLVIRVDSENRPSVLPLESLESLRGKHRNLTEFEI